MKTIFNLNILIFIIIIFYLSNNETFASNNSREVQKLKSQVKYLEIKVKKLENLILSKNHPSKSKHKKQKPTKKNPPKKSISYKNKAKKKHPEPKKTQSNQTQIKLKPLDSNLSQDIQSIDKQISIINSKIDSLKSPQNQSKNLASTDVPKKYKDVYQGEPYQEDLYNKTKPSSPPQNNSNEQEEITQKDSQDNKEKNVTDEEDTSPYSGFQYPSRKNPVVISPKTLQTEKESESSNQE